jgi:hypothetical protein
MEVELTDAEGDEVNNDPAFLSWKLQLAPVEVKKIKFHKALNIRKTKR